ncbi:hypothetical protein [Synechococcus sp. MIT S9507]|uniref:hypothetical protein n=1 Tax=Synechococcus sp. MIT S9507 TaxID=3082544 RepID=UPI0039B5117E
MDERDSRKACPERSLFSMQRSAMARLRTSELLKVKFRNGTVIKVQTPKGTLPTGKLVRAFQKGCTVLPDGSVHFSSKPVQAVLEPYSEKLKEAAEIERQMQSVNWRHWKEQGLKDNGWIKFRRVLRKLFAAYAFSSASN